MTEWKLDFDLPHPLPARLPVLPLRKGVLLPAAVSPFAVGRPRSRAALEAADRGLLLIAVQREPIDDPGAADFLPVGVLARVVEHQASRGAAVGVIFQGVCRVRLEDVALRGDRFEARFTPVEERWPDSATATAMLETIRAHIDSVDGEVDARLIAALKRIDRPVLLVDFVAALLEADEDWRRDILLTLDPIARAEKVLRRYLEGKEVAAARRAIEDRLRGEQESNAREAVLRRQLKAIQDELGDGDDDELERLAKRLAEKDLPREVREAVDRELKRARRIQGQSAERSVALDWLGWIADLPWNAPGGGPIDLPALEAALEATHHGLDDVKRQVVEHLAVKKLGGEGRADVLLLVGPPGVGKTSIGQAIAEATARKLVRVALGGVRDEAELRGHRRTYVGARPGRLIEGIRRGGASDPVVLLDEIDKLGADYRGDPASALLEILDPEQNHHFVDHYLEVPFDLSKILFVATANDLSRVPAPLRDRMEVIEIDGYTERDKLTIARKHLFEKLAKNAGIAASEVILSDEAIEDAIVGWTREAGVRQLQRALAKIFRAAAVKKARAELDGPLEVGKGELASYLGRRKHHDEIHDAIRQPGVATGLAWTPTGGDVLYVEASTLPGNGQLTLTGQLGDVMKESARAALTYVLAHAEALGIEDGALAKRDVHIHVPAGGVPKDGPSAGVTMFTALASLLSHRPIANDIAMTGEATLRGRVLPVGGIKSKVLAAHRRGLKRVIIPKQNAGDLEDLPEQARNELEFILVDAMDEVLAVALAKDAPPSTIEH